MAERKRRLVIISYRLPFKLIREGRKISLGQNSGGLVSAILSFTEKLKQLLPQQYFSSIAWVGYSQNTKRDFRRAQGRDSLFDLYPVQLEETLNKKFYEGFSNNLLWPLLHYFPSYAEFDDDYFEQYVNANRIFCDSVLRMLRPDDLIWVHDYHLLLLPQMIRERKSRAAIGLFLHIPFPSFEIFRLLPRRWRVPILKGMLGADLVGFHTFDYAYHFLKSVRKVLGIDHVNRILSYDNRKIKTDAFPISIDYEKFSEATQLPEVKNEIDQLNKILEGQKLIFSVDRLDYTKGLVHRLQGYEYFLKQHPEWHKKVVFNMVVVPSRDLMPQYTEMRNQIDAMVGRINSQYNTLAWRPIIYQYKSLQFHEMVALYDRSDVGLITPVRDGMNLVAKEYIASQGHKAGVLILSEMAGAAAELQDALIVNPTDKLEIAEAILKALTMPEEERKKRMQHMQERLQQYDVVDWTTDFIQQLKEVRKMNETESSNLVTPAVVRSIVSDYNRSKKRVLLFDYDGTLIPFYPEPQLAIPDNELLEMLRQFGSDPKNIVVLISGRNKEFLQRWFGMLPVTLVAEHGAFTKMADSDWMRITPENAQWKDSVKDVLHAITLKYPGSMMEMKEQSIAWHYRGATDVTRHDVDELKEKLTAAIDANDLQVLEGSKVVEIKHRSYSKGTAVQSFLSMIKEDFLLAIGDDKTDEDLFSAIPPHAYTIKVGESSGNARYFVRRQEDVLALLQKLLSENLVAG